MERDITLFGIGIASFIITTYILRFIFKSIESDRIKKKFDKKMESRIKELKNK